MKTLREPDIPPPLLPLSPSTDGTGVAACLGAFASILTADGHRSLSDGEAAVPSAPCGWGIRGDLGCVGRAPGALLEVVISVIRCCVGEYL